MRKMVVLLAAVAALLAVGVGNAVAQEGDAPSGVSGAAVTTDKAGNQVVNCVKVPCTATGSSDRVNERVGNGKKDRILLKGGSDRVQANTYTNDKDVIKGSSGNDLIYVDDGDTRDRIFGGRGGDKCYVDSRSEIVSGCSAVVVR